MAAHIPLTEEAPSRPQWDSERRVWQGTAGAELGHTSERRHGACPAPGLGHTLPSDWDELEALGARTDAVYILPFCLVYSP